MDEMKIKISTKFMRDFVSKQIANFIFNKFGFKPEIQINELKLELVEGKICFHGNVDGKIDETDLLKVNRLKD